MIILYQIIIINTFFSGNNTFADDITDEFLFNLVRNNIDDSSILFGSAIAVEEFIVPRYKRFCPYAYKKDGVYAHDISLNYNYSDSTTEWYFTLQQQDWSNHTVTENYVTYR